MKSEERALTGCKVIVVGFSYLGLHETDAVFVPQPLASEVRFGTGKHLNASPEKYGVDTVSNVWCDVENYCTG
jgi:hypothetical protein